MIKKCSTILLVLVIASVLLFSACGEPAATTTPATTTPATTTTPPPEPKTLKIGLIGGLTGDVSFYWLPEVAHAQIYVDLLNEKGGITVQGQQYLIELVSVDTKFTPEGAVAAANKLIFDDEVDFAIGGCAFENPAMTPIFEQNKVIRIQWFTAGGPEEVNIDTPHTFVGVLSGAMQMSLLIANYKDHFPDAKTAVVLSKDEGPGTANWLIPVIEEPVLEANGFTVLNKGNPIIWPADMEDFTPIANQVDALKPDVLVFGGPGQAQAAILRQLRAAGNMCGAISMTPPASTYIDVLGMDATKILFVDLIGKTPDTPPLLDEIFDRLEEEEGPIVPGETLLNFSVACDLDVLLKIIEKADSLDPDVIIDTWQSTDLVTDSVFGNVYLSGDEAWGPNKALSCGYGYVILMDGEIAETGWMNAYPIP